ncbi:MAG TPA: NAD(P)H-dependent oxidoreductase [Myxococcales bacterium]|jgi:FMN-dependent NADH-azoreductase
MTVLLDVFASPRRASSRTRALRNAFVEAWLKAHPGGQVLTVDLPALEVGIPELDEWDVEAKLQMMYGRGQLTEELAKRWDTLTRFTDQLHLADVVLISSPMWNFSIPWTLKRWLDVVVQPRLTFEVRDGAFHGLLRGRKGVLLLTRDGAYGPGTAHEKMDFQLPYLRQVMGFLGIDPVHAVVAEPLSVAGPDVATKALAKAMDEAVEIAKKV